MVDDDRTQRSAEDAAPHEREFQEIRDRDEPLTEPPADEHRDEDVVKRETEAAATEAGEIGGRGTEIADEAERARAEHGGGEAEGFEQAEEALAEQAQHGEGRDPSADQYEVLDEARRDTAAHGDPDRIRSTETLEDLPAEDGEGKAE